MSAFTIGDLFLALALGVAIGLAVLGGFKSQHKYNSHTLRSLQQQMGPLFSVSLFASGALPTVAMFLIASLRNAPTSFDAIMLVVLIGSGMVASYTLLGNSLKSTVVRQ